MKGNPCDRHWRRSWKLQAQGAQMRRKRMKTALRLFPFPGPTCRACWRPLSKRNGNALTEPGHPWRISPRCSLSPQELRVLHLLISGQTYAEMAEALIVSPNTIKTQVSSIYRKLGVSRRAEAIAETARLHLL